MAEHRISPEYLAGYERILADVAETGRPLSRAELRTRREFGERAAEAGHGLRTLVGGHLLATRAAWPGPDAPAHRLLAAVEQAIDAFVEGFEHAQNAAVRQEEAARRGFVDDLLHAGSDLGRLAERAERFGLRFSHTHAVAVAGHRASDDDSGSLLRRVEQALFARFGARRILLTTKDGRLVCIAPGDQDEVLTHFARQTRAAADGTPVAIGRPHSGAGGVVHSYEEALGVLDLAERMDLAGPVLRAAELLVYPVLTRDRDAMADLVRHTLGPLRDARGGAVPLLDTLTAYFDTGCNAAAAARRLRLGVRTLTYRLERVHRLTGADPADPEHRYMLQTAVIGARLLDWPRQEL
ncbi:PucR family transcriptional regulator [Streptomyces sp. WAC07061]|uniref:PucR family transcriptional regulator n=1 Tax=Streptomyces sp. WAC07061 TaxID=2487410 RepID=UPI000F774B09|nr:helix-turn-helix domain-containing protein [Streptomyces sp. WAC07061]RSS45611.1 PucR family transcriptional regulator [Streptomyces sp. WAC07061]